MTCEEFRANTSGAIPPLTATIHDLIAIQSHYGACPTCALWLKTETEAFAASHPVEAAVWAAEGRAKARSLLAPN